MVGVFWIRSGTGLSLVTRLSPKVRSLASKGPIRFDFPISILPQATQPLRPIPSCHICSGEPWQEEFIARLQLAVVPLSSLRYRRAKAFPAILRSIAPQMHGRYDYPTTT